MAVPVVDERVLTGLSAVRIGRRGVAALVDGLDVDAVPFGDVTELWKAFDGIERLAANAKTLLAARVERTGDWKRAGAKSAAEHLARLGGTTVIEARRSLETSKQVAELPAVLGALQSGALSKTQADAVAGAASADPGSERRLLEVAQRTSVHELRDACLKTRAAADPDPDTTYRRIHAGRHVRTHMDAEGAWNIVGRATADRGARLEAILEPKVNELFNEAHAHGRREPREAYVFDALMAMLEQEPTADKKPKRMTPRFLGLLHAPIETLIHGWIEGEQTCELPGYGPIPVRVARELLGESILKLVITNGVDVVNVTHLGRGATAAQRVALLWSKPQCANVECSSTFTQIDHRIPWATTRHTRLDELDPLCPHHHRLKTNQGWGLVNGTGRRAFVPPHDPRHPRNKPPP